MTRPRILLALVLLLLSTAAFAESADVLITPWTDSDHRFAFWAYNAGPDLAKNVVLTIDVPAELTVQVYEAYGTCDTSTRPIRCTSPTLAIIGDTVALDFSVSGPPANASYTMTATVTSDTPDPNLANNSGTNRFTTKLITHLAASITPSAIRLDPGVPMTFLTTLSNYGDSHPTNVKTKFVATNAIIEKVEPTAPSVSCTVASDGLSAECFAAQLAESCRCIEQMNVTAHATSGRAGGVATIAVSGTSDLPETFPSQPATATLQTYRWLSVTNTNDTGDGSLRTAIEQANQLCSPAPCKIVFEIPPPVPSSGWFTITPSTPLPKISGDRVNIDGFSQKTTTGDTNNGKPVIAIDGHLAHSGLVLESACEAVMRGLAIGNFDADQGLWFTTSRSCNVPPYSEIPMPDQHLVSGNFIGVDPSGDAWPNLRGIRADDAVGAIIGNVISDNTRSGIWMWRGGIVAHDNVMERNGASGIFLGPQTAFAEILRNTIRDSGEMGVAIARGAVEVDIRQNAMRDNGGLGIDWSLDGVSPREDDDFGKPTNAPTLLSATYDPASNATRVSYTIKSNRLGPYFNSGVADFYANRTPDGDGERWVYAGQFPANETVKSVIIPADLRGQWITATWTRVSFDFLQPPTTPRVSTNAFAGGHTLTSELSNSVLVQ